MAATINVTANISKNRLYATLAGFLSDDEAKRVADLLVSEGQKLTSGFTVINDITELKPITSVGLEHIKDAQKTLKQLGVKRVMRVVDQKNITTKMQFFRIGKEAYQEDCVQTTTSTVAEAEALLDALK
jgi:hypothetical protein